MAYEYMAVDLPGKILYDKDFEVSIRKITPIEQKYITSLGQKQQKSINDYIDFIRKLITFNKEDVKFEDLFWFDVKYLLYRIRFSTYTKYPIKLQFECTDCNEEIIVPLDMGNLIINTPDDNPNHTTSIALETLGETKIRTKTIGDDLAVEEFCKARNITDDDMRILLFDLCLVANGKSLEEMYKLAEEGVITAEDILNIEKWFDDNSFGVKEETIVKCPKCGKEESRTYILRLDSFFSAF